MHSQSKFGRKWRRFNREHGQKVFIVFLVLGLLFAVALLMWVLTSPAGRPI